MFNNATMYNVVFLRRVEEDVIAKHIINSALKTLADLVNVDVVVVGAGPSGLTASRYLAARGLKTVVVERRLSFGGGIGGGGALLPCVIVQSPADEVLREVGCRVEEVEEGLYAVSPAEMIAKLASSAIDAGARIVLGMTVNDLVYRVEGGSVRVVGVVVQWSAVEMSGLHVDPLAIKARAVIDATGHDAEVLNIASRKIPELNLKIPGEKSMWASLSEELVVKHTGKVCEGLYVTGMAVAALHNLPRMGPIFGGMLLSGRRVAEIVIEDLSKG